MVLCPGHWKTKMQGRGLLGTWPVCQTAPLGSCFPLSFRERPPDPSTTVVGKLPPDWATFCLRLEGPWLSTRSPQVADPLLFRRPGLASQEVPSTCKLTIIISPPAKVKANLKRNNHMSVEKAKGRGRAPRHSEQRALCEHPAGSLRLPCHRLKNAGPGPSHAGLPHSGHRRLSGSLMKQVARGIFGMRAALPGPEGQVFWEHTLQKTGALPWRAGVPAGCGGSHICPATSPRNWGPLGGGGGGTWVCGTSRGEGHG